MMKKVFAIVTMLLTLSIACAQSNSCQDIKTFSIKPYVGLSVNLLSTTAKKQLRIGLNTGVEGQYQFSKFFALSAGVGYSQQGGKMEHLIFEPTHRVTFDNKLDFINVPVMANFYVCKGLALKIGVQPGFLINNKVEVTDKETGENVPGNYQDHLNKFILALPLGISYEFKNIVFDTRLHLTYQGMYKKTDNNNTPVCGNGVIQTTVGYRF